MAGISDLEGFHERSLVFSISRDHLNTLSPVDNQPKQFTPTYAIPRRDTHLGSKFLCRIAIDISGHSANLPLGILVQDLADGAALDSRCTEYADDRHF